MPYNIAGIDVHKRMLHVVFSDVEVDGEYEFTRQVFASSPQALRSLVAWLVKHQVEEVVMESTAQYWKPVWGALERYWKPARVGKERCQARDFSIWPTRCQTGGGAGARRISSMPSVW